ncbi:hypothetical protein P167DRAFT_537699 [Morchella conica CCBAS932]|uniref:Histidyl-tRNA synthetase n=1 Tax=Morchella conica CCBAS932 TaxID=1392247 RepID=A0A3N4KI95_9PEZI|nr:hypothetical protein P167DRAFT_537699 [Morchella conica CCBAS932]
MDDSYNQQGWTGRDIVIRDKIFNTAVEVFKRHGGVRMDTPYVASQEISRHNLSPEALHLRARVRLLESIERWLLKNPEVKSTKRYMIMRDCIQRIPCSDWDGIDPSDGPEDPVCNFSIVGVHDDILPDAEILGTLAEILSKLDINDYKIRINHRKIADGIFESCGASKDASASIRFAISLLRLKKEFQSDDDFQIELEKLLSPETARILSQYLSRKGGRHLQYDLLLEEDLTVNETFSSGLREMGLLFYYLEMFGVMDRIDFDLSYTPLAGIGVVFMVVAPNPSLESSPSQITKPTGDLEGSICLATGSRNNFRREKEIQVVSFSLDVNKTFDIIKKKLSTSSRKEIRESETEVYVMSFGDGLLRERIQVCKKLWGAGFKAEFSYQKKPELSHQMTTARESGIPFAVILSEQLLQQQKVKVLDLSLRESHIEKTGVDVNLLDLATEIKQRLEDKQDEKEDDGEGDTDSESTEDIDSGAASGGERFHENVKKVKLEGGTVDMEGIEIEMDFAKITSKGAQIEVQGAKIKMKNAKIELRGRKE